MTLVDAIKHAEEVANENDDSAKEFYRVSKLETHPDRKLAEDGYVKCKKCADEHRQLAEWLKELKERREKDASDTNVGSMISKQAAIGTIKRMKDVCDTDDINDYYNLLIEAFNVLPSAQPEPCLDSIVSEIKKTISEMKENGKYHYANIRINGEMMCHGLQLALEIIEEKRNGQSDKQAGVD